MRTIIEKEGIVIRSSPYKENDAMVNILTSEGVFSFRARGAFKVGSKSASCTTLLSHSKFSLEVGKGGGLYFYEGELVKSAPQKDDLGVMGSLSFIGECSSKLLSEEAPESSHLYPWLESSLNLLNQGFSPLTICLLFLARILEEMGYGLNVDECVYCHQKSHIIGVSFIDGGFYCEKENANMGERLSPLELKMMRYIFRCNCSDEGRVEFPPKETKQLLKDLCIYCQDQTGVALKSLEILLQC